MATVLITEQEPVAKKSKPAAQPASPPLNASGQARIEFVADPEWLVELDAAAESLGMGRSAYIRMACNHQMQADRKARNE